MASAADVQAEGGTQRALGAKRQQDLLTLNALKMQPKKIAAYRSPPEHRGHHSQVGIAPQGFTF